MSVTDEVWSAIEKAPGWCWREKAEAVMKYASEPHVKKAVEIGVFGGRSLLPLCLAVVPHGGDVWGFDVYTKHPMPNEAHQEWWDKLDFEQLYTDAKDLLDRFNMGGYRILRLSSREASERFWRDSIQFVHIDGSHRTWDAVEDIVMWNLKLAPGGYMLLDDTNWQELALAMELMKHGPLEHVETLKGASGEAQFWRKP